MGSKELGVISSIEAQAQMIDRDTPHGKAQTAIFRALELSYVSKGASINIEATDDGYMFSVGTNSTNATAVSPKPTEQPNPTSSRESREARGFQQAVNTMPVYDKDAFPDTVTQYHTALGKLGVTGRSRREAVSGFEQKIYDGSARKALDAVSHAVVLFDATKTETLEKVS